MQLINYHWKMDPLYLLYIPMHEIIPCNGHIPWQKKKPQTRMFSLWCVKVFIAYSVFIGSKLLFQGR